MRPPSAVFAGRRMGKKIAFTAPEPQTEQERSDIRSGRDWTVVDEDYKLTELWVMDPATGISARVTDAMNVTNFEWSLDGGSIIFQASERPGFDNVYMFQKIFSGRRRKRYTGSP